MKVDKLAVVAGGALIIFVVAYFIMQALKANPKFGGTFGTTVKATLTPTQAPGQVASNNGKTMTANSGNIVVNSPVSGSSVSSVFVVKGRARVFENVVNYRVSDTKSNVLLEGSVLAKSKDAGQFGDFNFTISGLTGKGQIILQLFDYSAKDGSEIDKVIIPLNLN